MRRFVLFDRDGTLIRERHYLSDPDHVELINGVASGLIFEWYGVRTYRRVEPIRDWSRFL